MDKKRKYPNIIDVVFLFLIAAVALTAYFLSHDSTENVNTVTASYTVELTDPEGLTADSVKIGDRVTDNARGYDMGSVTAVEALPSALRITVEAGTVENEKGISTASGCSIRVGTQVWCTVGTLSAKGTVVELSR